MTRVLPLLLLCACAGSLVDHNDPALTGNVTCEDGTFKIDGVCRNATRLSAGTSHTCAVVAGEARCWGANDRGQLGRAALEQAPSFVPARAAVPGTVSAIAAGALHTCAIADGDVWCWGDNSFGQLGLGTVGGTFATPQKVNLSGASLLAAGRSHTCAVTATEMRCWGRNDSGQLGNAATLPEAPRPEPTQVVGVGVPVDIAAGNEHTCAVTSGVLCWGNNGAGQLGINVSGGAYSTPTLISSSSLNGASFVGLGANHSCAGTVANTLSCWGANGVYQVDTSGQDQKSPRPVPVASHAVAAGTGHTCAISPGQRLNCWGLNTSFQLGNPTTEYDPVDVGLADVSWVAAGSKHTCAIASGKTLCWGLNDRGQLGVDNASTPSTATPTAVSAH